jgi:sulfotransferase family protein
MEDFSLDFVAVGPARTATTWLHNALRQHASLPTTKETRFWDLYFKRGARWYAAQFGQRRDGLPTGEVAPTYFHSGIARERIQRFAPCARIICTLRDPVERLYSLYRYKRSRGAFGWSFERALTRDEEMAESGHYVKHLTAWMEAFGSSNVLTILYDDINQKPQAAMDAMCKFIGAPLFALDPGQLSRVNSSDGLNAPRNFMLAQGMRSLGETFDAFAVAIGLNAPFRLARWRGIKRFLVGNDAELPPLDPSLAADLRRRLTPEVAELERIIGRDLWAWKAPI